MRAWVEVRKIAALSNIEDYLGKTVDSHQRAMLKGWREEILAEIPEQSPILNRYKRLKTRKSNPILCVEIEENSFRRKSSESIPCPGCYLILPFVHFCHLQRMDYPVFCQNCGRILYSDGFFAHSWHLEQKDIESGEISLPRDLDLGSDPTFRDMYGRKVGVVVDKGFLTALKGVFSSYGLKEGDILKLRVLSLEDNEYAFVPEIIKPDLIQEELSFEEIEEIIDEKSQVLGRGLARADTIGDGKIDLERLPTKHRVTLDEDSIKEGTLKIPAGLAGRLEDSHTILSELGGFGDLQIEWNLSSKTLRGLGEWYDSAALESGDYVNIKLQSEDPRKLTIWTEWRRSIDKLLEMPPEDLIWQDIPIRNCLVFLLKKLDREAHYRELYAEISRHRELAIGSTIGTLSKYREILFSHTGKGLWKLLGEPSRERVRKEWETQHREEHAEDWKRVWAAVQEIEERDFVFRILKHKKEPLSFQEICQFLGDHLRVDPKLLEQTGFLNPKDHRLQRIDTGSWVLREWVQPTPEILEPETIPEEPIPEVVEPETIPEEPTPEIVEPETTLEQPAPEIVEPETTLEQPAPEVVERTSVFFGLRRAHIWLLVLGVMGLLLLLILAKAW